MCTYGPCVTCESASEYTTTIGHKQLPTENGLTVVCTHSATQQVSSTSRTECGAKEARSEKGTDARDARPAGATGSRAGNRSTSGEEWREEGPRECREAVVVTGACSQAKLLQAELDPGPGSLTRPVTVPQLLQVPYYLLGRPVLSLSRARLPPSPSGQPAAND